MSWLTDTEQKTLLTEEPGPTTSRIRREIAVAIRQVDARQKQLQEQLQAKLSEHDGYLTVFRRLLKVKKKQ